MPRMAPTSTPRQLWLWSLPSLVLLLSLVWYKRKRNTLRSDPGGTSNHVPEAEHLKLDGEEEEISSQPICSEPDTTCESREDLNSDSDPVNSSSSKSREEFVLSPTTPASEELLTSIKVSGTEEAPSFSPELKREVSLFSTLRESGETQKCVDASKKAEEIVSSSAEAGNISAAAKEVEEVSVIKCQEPESNMKETNEEVVAPVPAPSEEKDNNDKVVVLEDKLASLTLGSSEEQRRGAERDSANHSPVDAMLASPSMSSYSDEHSEGSSDSGKGCSDVASPPSRTPVGSGSLAGDAEVDTGIESTSSYSVYDFLLPQLLVGRLIGRHGSVVHEIKAKTNATIWIKSHPDTLKHKICSVEGTPADIEHALAMIRQRFPPRKYPNVSLEQVHLAPAAATFPLVPDFCQLHLVEGVNNEVMISSLVSPAHMFVQQPYHPSYQYLQRLNLMMNSVYGTLETPNLPDPIEVGNICVAPAVDGWYRAQVVSTNEETQSSEIKFVDYGGYMTVNNSVLRQIRQDFMTLPFQATECYLANIKPSGESGEWSMEALRIVEELTRGQMLLAQVYDYAADGVPLIYLYSSVNSQVVLINQELVVRRLADPDSAASSTPSEAASLVVAAAAVAASVAGETSTSSEATDSTALSSSTGSEEEPKAVDHTSAAEVTAN